MCWMTLQQKTDALARSIVDTNPHEHGNGHSWGYAYAHDGEIHIEKGTGTIPETVDVPVTQNAIVHTRFATRGEVNRVNAHPFGIIYDGDVVAALAHNGTWLGAPRSDKYSDTWMMARLLERNLNFRDGDFEAALADTVDTTGETVVVLSADGTGYVHAGRFSITHNQNGVVASSGYDELSAGLYRFPEQGELTLIEEGAEQETIRTYVE